MAASKIASAMGSRFRTWPIGETAALHGELAALGLKLPAAAIDGTDGADHLRGRHPKIGVGVMVVDHGSKREAANERLMTLCAAYAESHAKPDWVVAPAHMELASPSIEEAFDALVAQATTLSCSLGPSLGPVMTKLLKHTSHKPILYACENDHDAVAALTQALEGKATVVDCVVDRVSTDRAVTADGVAVTAEAWPGAIVPLDAAVNRASPPPFGSTFGAEILAPRSSAAARYLSDRKLNLVNGMHTTLAFATIRDAHAVVPGDLHLAKPSSAGIITREIWHWALARCAILVREHGLDTIKEVHGLDDDDAAFDALTAYARQALERFQLTDDTVARVLGGGVA